MYCTYHDCRDNHQYADKRQDNNEDVSPSLSSLGRLLLIFNSLLIVDSGISIFGFLCWEDAFDEFLNLRI